jgi:hypothetical protein
MVRGGGVAARTGGAFAALAAMGCALAAAAEGPAAAPAAAIRHRFLAVDESRGQLHYVDQAEPSKDWTIKLPARCRDAQLIGGDKVLVSAADGYRQYSLRTRDCVKEAKGFKGSQAARRLPDGRTVLACNDGGVTIYELDSADKVLRKAKFEAPQTRLMRLTPQGTVLFGSGNVVTEGDLQGKVLATATLAAGSWAYQALRLPSGNLLVSAGYDPAVLELDAAGQVVRRFGGKDAPGAEGMGLHFAGGFQVLPNGHVVVSNWTGHGPADSAKGVQLVEYDAAGKIVWTWHDAERAGTIHGVIVLDGLDTKVLNDDASSVLGPVGRGR